LSPPTPTPKTEPVVHEPPAIPDAGAEGEPQEIDMSTDPGVADPRPTDPPPTTPNPRVAANPTRPTRPPTTPQPRLPKQPTPPVEKPVVEKPDPQTPPVEAGCDEVSCVLD